MQDRDVRSKILGSSATWDGTGVILDVPAGRVEVVTKHGGDACCPKCGKTYPGYDTGLRRWRY